MTTKDIGNLGELLACKFLKNKRYKILENNLHVSHNELDIVALDKKQGFIVFVEVKTRRATPGERSRYGRPAAAIDKAKRDRMRKAAQDYLREHPTEKQPRIDVSEVYLGKSADGSVSVLDVKIFPAAYAGR
jgi:putative endonuclease